MTEGICILDFAKELEFWMIKDVMIDICCSDKFIARREHVQKEMAKAKALEEIEVEEEINFGSSFFAPYQKILFDLFEKPQSSTAAKLLSLWSILWVSTSLTPFVEPPTRGWS